jgi:hypothetical protein
MRTVHATLLGGYHRPGRTQSMRQGLHAVSPRLDAMGARRSACGLIARFVPTNDWEPFPLEGGYRCEKCLHALADPTARERAEKFA